MSSILLAPICRSDFFNPAFVANYKIYIWNSANTVMSIVK